MDKFRAPHYILPRSHVVTITVSKKLFDLVSSIQNWSGPSYITMEEAMRLYPEQLADHAAKGRTHEYDPKLQRFVSPNQTTQRLIALDWKDGKLVFGHDRVEVWEAPHVHGVATTTNPLGRIQAGVTYQVRQFVNRKDDDTLMMNPPHIFAQPCAMGFNESAVLGPEAAWREMSQELGVESITPPHLLDSHVASNTFVQSWTPIHHAHVPFEATNNERTDWSEMILHKEFMDVTDILRNINAGSEERVIDDGDGNEVTATFNWGAALPNMSFIKWLMTNPNAWRQASEAFTT